MSIQPLSHFKVLMTYQNTIGAANINCQNQLMQSILRQYKPKLIMDCCFASMNTKGFQSALDSNRLPQSDHITYEGAFNELKFSIGPKAKESLELHIGYARAQNQTSSFDKGIHQYLAIFTKGSKDGQDRDQRPLNSVIVLDISGSMGSGLTSKGQGCRLTLAKQAIKMFYSKLRPTDAFGLVVFDTVGQTIIPCTQKSAINEQNLYLTIDQITTRGGTTLKSGFDEAQKNMLTYLANYAKKNEAENRIIMMTDVGDNSMSNANVFVSNVQQSGIHTTIIGISDDFKSETCQKMNEIKGFNYFCATEIGDLKKYLFQNFSFTFFPSNYNIQIGLINENVKRIQVFGTVDAKRVNEYNSGFALNNKNVIITKTKTSFPSELQLNANGEVKTYGGLIIVKLTLKQQMNKFEGIVTVNYETTKHEKLNKQYKISYECPINEQYFSDESLSQALSAFHYVYEIRKILEQVNKNKKTKESNAQFCKSLKQLRVLAPKSKLDQLQKMIKVMENNPEKIYEQVNWDV